MDDQFSVTASSSLRIVESYTSDEDNEIVEIKTTNEVLDVSFAAQLTLVFERVGSNIPC